MDRYPRHAVERAAKVAVILLGLVIVVDLVATVFDLIERGSVESFRQGDAGAARAADHRRAAAGIAEGVALFVCAVTFLHWFRIAYRNVLRLGVAEEDLRRSPGWAVGGWFVPVVSLFFPKQIADDIYRTSDLRQDAIPWPRRAVPALLHWWWAVWLISNVFDRIAINAFDHADDLTALASADAKDIASLAVEIAAAVLAILVVRRITERQQEALASGAENQPQPPTLPVVPAPGL